MASITDITSGAYDMIAYKAVPVALLAAALSMASFGSDND